MNNSINAAAWACEKYQGAGLPWLKVVQFNRPAASIYVRGIKPLQAAPEKGVLSDTRCTFSGAAEYAIERHPMLSPSMMQGAV